MVYRYEFLCVSRWIEYRFSPESDFGRNDLGKKVGRMSRIAAENIVGWWVD